MLSISMPLPGVYKLGQSRWLSQAHMPPLCLHMYEPQFISLHTSKWLYEQRLCYAICLKPIYFWDTLYKEVDPRWMKVYMHLPVSVSFVSCYQLGLVAIGGHRARHSYLSHEQLDSHPHPPHTQYKLNRHLVWWMLNDGQKKFSNYLSTTTSKVSDYFA